MSEVHDFKSSKTENISFSSILKFDKIFYKQYLDQITAQKVDEELMNEYGFSLDNLMELAGQSVAHATYEIGKKYLKKNFSKIFIIAGPGSFLFESYFHYLIF